MRHGVRRLDAVSLADADDAHAGAGAFALPRVCLLLLLLLLSARLLGALLHRHTLRGPARALSDTRTLTLLLSLPRTSLRTPAQYLRANAAIIAANSHGSGLVPCAGFHGRPYQRSPGSTDAGNGQEFCSYDGSMSNGNSKNADSYRLCCCVDTFSIPPEDASTGCPFTSSDCDTSDWMALNPTKYVFFTAEAARSRLSLILALTTTAPS